MYHAKKHGRDRYAWFEIGMKYELRLRDELEAGIRRNLSTGSASSRDDDKRQRPDRLDGPAGIRAVHG